MKVLVCGSRDWNGTVLLRQRLAELPAGTLVMHGGARGADKDAGCIAAELGLPVVEFPANWDLYGKRAGILRNLAMLDENPDLVLAFWDGKSRGTAHTISEARKRGIPVEVISE